MLLVWIGGSILSSLSTSSGFLYFFFWLVGETVANEFVVHLSSDNPSPHFTLHHLNTCATERKNVEAVVQSLYSVLGRPNFQSEELVTVGEWSKVCSQIGLCLARIGRLDILWSVNKLARAVTMWTRACDKRLARLISYIHHTSEFKQHCHVGETLHNNADWDCFRTLFLTEILKTETSTSVEFCVSLESRTFVPFNRI